MVAETWTVTEFFRSFRPMLIMPVSGVGGGVVLPAYIGGRRLYQQGRHLARALTDAPGAQGTERQSRNGVGQVHTADALPTLGRRA